jgi:hypothetical protein
MSWSWIIGQVAGTDVYILAAFPILPIRVAIREAMGRREPTPKAVELAGG